MSDGAGNLPISATPTAVHVRSDAGRSTPARCRRCRPMACPANERRRRPVRGLVNSSNSAASSPDGPRCGTSSPRAAPRRPANCECAAVGARLGGEITSAERGGTPLPLRSVAATNAAALAASTIGAARFKYWPCESVRKTKWHRRCRFVRNEDDGRCRSEAARDGLMRRR